MYVCTVTCTSTCVCSVTVHYQICPLFVHIISYKEQALICNSYTLSCPVRKLVLLLIISLNCYILNC